MNQNEPERSVVEAADLPARYRRLRQDSEALAQPLSEADMTVQSMEDASPTKWHLAHTTWFFEEFVLTPLAAEDGKPYRAFNPAYRFLFNSYYEAVGPRQPRPRRGLLTRPPLAEVLAYRHQVDAALLDRLTAGVDAATLDLVELGLQHEQQHQELMLTDILHLFAQNPLRPAYRPAPPAAPAGSAAPPEWIAFAGGVHPVGRSTTLPGAPFAFDCEGPRHEVLLPPFALAARPVSNAEWLAFMADGAYRRPELWLSDGWRTVQAEGWSCPLYWQQQDDGEWRQMTLRGLLPLDAAAPVCHLGYYEAEAFARWVGKRLPTEFEWEHAASALPVAGNFVGSGRLRPAPATAAASGALQQMFGDVWEWTASPFVAYPGFRAAAGALGEYNGKFMCGQMVLRGGSCVSPANHLRASYRNFFYPHQRWQFSGLRLADDR
jgi:ergothioneine biosynthesis protein EgtB